MSRLLFLLFAFAVSLLHVKAQQTYYYVCNKKVDGNGVAMKHDKKTYFTFVNNVCYESDRYGNLLERGGGYMTPMGWKKLTSNTYYYIGIKNGNYVYQFNNPMPRWYDYIIVSKDFSSLNVTEDYDLSNIGQGRRITVYVYKRTTPSEETDNIPNLIE